MYKRYSSTTKKFLLFPTLLLAAFSFPVYAQDNSRARELYDTPELFEQLSSAKQNLLELKFGKKNPRRVQYNANSAKGKIEEQAQLIAPQGYSPMGSIANTLVNNAAADATSQDTQSETALVVGSSGIVIAGFNDSGSFQSNNHFTGTSRSTNSGNTWTDLGMLPNSTDGDAGDPVLARNNTTGTIYLATLSFTNDQNLSLFRSTNNGASWLLPVNSAPGFTTSTGSQDKEWIAVDNFAGTGNGNVYQFWRNFGIPGGMTFTRSTNDGVTWGPSGGLTLASGGQGAWVVVGPDHAVYCFWLSGTSLLLRKSTDQGVSFAAATTVATLLTTGTNGDLGLAFRTNAFPQVAINPISGNLYMVYNDNPVGTDRGDIYFRQSTNGGATWEAQVRVNSDAGTNDQWQPALAVTPDGARVGIMWYDRRNDPANTLIERFGVTGTISGPTVTFGNNFRISPQFPVVVGVDPVINSTYMGDYDQMDADNSFFYTVWGDNRNDATFPGATRKNANVRFGKIPINGPGAVMSVILTALTGGNGNGLVDFNECNDFTVTLANNGTATGTGIAATLSTAASNVTITTNSTPYPDIAVGGTATGVLPFKISTSNAYVCGTAIPLTLVVTYNVTDSDTFIMNAPVNGGGYTLTQSTGNTIVPGTTDIGNHDDDLVTNIALPFSYQFYDQAYTSVNASSNGNLQFASNSNAYLNACLPTTTFNYAILAHWDDQRTDSVGRGIFTSVSGVAPNRIFNIEWRSTLYSGGGSMSYEIRLYEGQKKFDIIYGTPLASTGSSATIGIQKATGSSFSQFSCNAASLSSGLMLTYTESGCVDGGGTCPVVPIQLASFTGRAIGANNVLIEWTTVSEINNYGFEIQRSAQQSGPFMTIPGSFVPGNGTTLVPQHYQWTDVNATSQMSFYRLKQIDLDGTVSYFDPIQINFLTGVNENSLPTEFSLSQNYPNPFNPSTIIRYGLPQNTRATIEIFNTLGQRVAVLVDEHKEAGYYEATFSSNALSSGVYFYKLTAGRFVESKKLLLIK